MTKPLRVSALVKKGNVVREAHSIQGTHKSTGIAPDQVHMIRHAAASQRRLRQA
ncbi:MAG: hypothetical protein ACJ8AW_08840 [Rhodopila sp.]